MGKRNKATQQMLRSSLALLTALAPLGWANALHVQSANSDAQITNSQSTTAPKPSERYKNEPFWKSISDSDREILDHFGINAASKLYHYARGIEALLIELGAKMDNPLTNTEEALKAIAPALTTTSELPTKMNETSKALIQQFGFRILTELNSRSNRLEDTLLGILEGQTIGDQLKIDIAQKLRSLSNQIQTDEDSREIDEGEIRAMMAKANDLRDKGLYNSAARIWELVSGRIEKALGPEHPSTATSLNSLAILYQRQGLYSKAEPLYLRTLATYEKALGHEHPYTAQAMDNLASLYKSQGFYAKAEPLLLKALAIREKILGHEHPDTAKSLNNLGMIYNRQGLHAKAEPFLLRALTIREQSLGPEHPDTATVLNNIAFTYHKQGLYAKAESLYIRALVITEKTLGPENPDTAQSLSNLATLYISQGAYAKAETLYIRALAITEKVLGGEHADTATVLNNLALNYKYQGLYSKAEGHYLRALAINEKALGPEHPATAQSLNNLASLYQSQGSHGKAELLYGRSLSIKEKTLGPEHPDTALSLGNLALLYHNQGFHGKAEPLYLRALAINEKALGSTHAYTAKILNNLALLYHSQNLYAKSKPLYLRALAITEESLGHEHPDTAAILLNLAVLYRSQGFYAKAEDLYIRALEISQKALDTTHPQTASTLSELSLLYWEKGSYSQAISKMKESLETEVTWLSRELPTLASRDRSFQLAARGNAWEATFGWTDHNSQATMIALQARLNRQGLLQEIEQRQALLKNIPGTNQEKVKEAQRLTQQLASISLPSNQRASLREKRDRLLAELYRQSPNLQIQTVTTKDVAHALPTDTALIEFQRYRPFESSKPHDQRWGDGQYIALILDPDGSIRSIRLGSAAAIDAKVHKALAASAEDQQDAGALWAQLSDQILKPLLPHLSSSREWFISPDGELSRVPFAALPAPQQPNIPLAEAVQLRLITTGRELVRLQKANPAGSKPLVMANPSFDRKGTSTAITTASTASPEARRRSADLGSTRWNPLPASQQEGQAIASLLSTNLVSGAAATTTTLQRQQGPRVLHIATHGFFVADQESKPTDPLQIVQEQAPQLQGLRQEDPQLRSGLVLAGANQPDADPNDDGYLTAAEAVMLNLKGTELVVLSACSTGQGDIRTGEGVYGLQRSLTVAGARSTLLSLWKVDDAATAEFMMRFYTRLKAGEARSDALAATQKEFRDGTAGNGQWTSPFYWAAWQLVGDWRPIRDL